MQNLTAIDTFLASRFPADSAEPGCPHIQRGVRDAVAKSHFRLQPEKIDSTA